MGVAMIGLLHPGEMGAAIGRLITEQRRTVLWASAERSPATRRRAEQANFQDAGSITTVADRSDVLLSVCPPHAAIDTARAVAAAGFRGLYVDANAVSPTTTRKIAALVSEGGRDGGGAEFVDGGIIGGPPTRPGTTRLYLSGSQAEAIAELFAGTHLETRVISDEIGAASALKMAFAGWTKGSAALLLAMRALARAEGVEEELLRQWSESLPDLPDRSLTAARSASMKGWRWIGEMEEIEQTMAAAGLPGGFHQAAAEVYRRTPRGTGDAPEDSLILESVLAALLRAR